MADSAHPGMWHLPITNTGSRPLCGPPRRNLTSPLLLLLRRSHLSREEWHQPPSPPRGFLLRRRLVLPPS